MIDRSISKIRHGLLSDHSLQCPPLPHPVTPTNPLLDLMDTSEASIGQWLATWTALQFCHLLANLLKLLCSVRIGAKLAGLLGGLNKVTRERCLGQRTYSKNINSIQDLLHPDSSVFFQSVPSICISCLFPHRVPDPSVASIIPLLP